MLAPSAWTPRKRDSGKVAEPIQTERLVLEPWDERWLDDWIGLCQDPEVMRYIGPGMTWEPETARAVFRRALDHWHEHGFGWRAPIDKATGTWLGLAGLNYLSTGSDDVAEDVEIGWWLIPSAWGKGLATEAASAVRDEAFARLKLDRIVGRYQPANVASGRIMERLGMTHEQDTTGKYGEPLRIYSLTRADWLALSDSPSHQRR